METKGVDRTQKQRKTETRYKRTSIRDIDFHSIVQMLLRFSPWADSKFHMNVPLLKRRKRRTDFCTKDSMSSLPLAHQVQTTSNWCMADKGLLNLEKIYFLKLDSADIRSDNQTWQINKYSIFLGRRSLVSLFFLREDIVNRLRILDCLLTHVKWRDTRFSLWNTASLEAFSINRKNEIWGNRLLKPFYKVTIVKSTLLTIWL